MASLSSIHVDRAVAALKQGGILAYPTEAVWGLGCDPFNQHAVLKLLALKQRPMAKGLILIAASVAQIESYLQLLRPQERQQVLDSWPSPWRFVSAHIRLSKPCVPLLVVRLFPPVPISQASHRH
ncbi:MAG: hypothetical protein RJA86_1105 [Pseudomonadota bacterium]